MNPFEKLLQPFPSPTRLASREIHREDISYLKWNRNRSANLLYLALSFFLSLSPAYVFFCMNLQFFPTRNRSDFSEAGGREQTSLLLAVSSRCPRDHGDFSENVISWRKSGARRRLLPAINRRSKSPCANSASCWKRFHSCVPRQGVDFNELGRWRARKND